MARFRSVGGSLLVFAGLMVAGGLAAIDGASTRPVPTPAVLWVLVALGVLVAVVGAVLVVVGLAADHS